MNVPLTLKYESFYFQLNYQQLNPLSALNLLVFFLSLLIQLLLKTIFSVQNRNLMYSVELLLDLVKIQTICAYVGKKWETFHIRFKKSKHFSHIFLKKLKHLQYFVEKMETLFAISRKKKLNIFHILLNKLKHILYFAQKSETLFAFCRKKSTQLSRFGEKI